MPSAGMTTEATASWPSNGAVVRRGQLEALHIQDGDIGIEECFAEPHRLDFGGDALPLLGFEAEIIDVFVVDHAIDRDVEGDLLRRA